MLQAPIPGGFLDQLTKRPRPVPVVPAASTSPVTRGGFGASTYALPGQQLGNTAPLASPSIGVVGSPTTMALAALAGVRAARAAKNNKGTLR